MTGTFYLYVVNTASQLTIDILPYLYLTNFYTFTLNNMWFPYILTALLAV